MSSPKYELFYFSSMGRAEAIRYIFAQAGVPYTDTRFKDRDEWLSEYKEKRSPFHVAPWLEVDGAKIGGAKEIARFLGEEFGLAGSNKIENAQLASIADFCDDMLFHAAAGIEAKEESEKTRLRQEFVEKSPKWLTTLEEKITESGSGWLFGNKLTWVDCHTAFFLSLLGKFGYPELLKDYSKLTALISSVESQPNIAKWIKERPQTPH